MDAIILAGGIPLPEDPLYSYSKGDSKALIDVAGKPMVQWVLDALSGAKDVENIIIVGLSPKNNLKSRKALHYLPNQGRMLSNIVSGVEKSLELNEKTEYVLVASSDIPALKSEMVNWLMDTCMQTRDDLYYGVCTRTIMEKRFPNSNRTYTKLKDIELCGADINITHVRMATDHLELWESLIGSRKTPLKQASIIGLGTFWKVFTRSITLDDLVSTVNERIGIKGRAIVWPHAEPCMDVDKPHQLELLRKDLEKQQKKAVSKTSKRKTATSTKAKASMPPGRVKTKTKPTAARKSKTTQTSKNKSSVVKNSTTTRSTKTKTKPKAKTKKK